MTDYDDYSSSASVEEYRPFDTTPVWRSKSPIPAPRMTLGYRRTKRLTLVVPAKHVLTVSRSAGKSTVAREFKRLLERWQTDTAFVSDPSQVILNSAYQRIIGLGRPAVPLVIRELLSNGGDWFWALHYMTGSDPVEPSTWGNFDKMRAAWAAWWAKHETEFA